MSEAFRTLHARIADRSARIATSASETRSQAITSTNMLSTWCSTDARPGKAPIINVSSVMSWSPASCRRVRTRSRIPMTQFYGTVSGCWGTSRKTRRGRPSLVTHDRVGKLLRANKQNE
jgi:hypothetical protein